MVDFLDEAVNNLPTLVGIKYSSNQLDIVLEAHRRHKDRYAIFMGNDFVSIKFENIHI